MLTPEKINAMKIISEEYKQLNSSPLVNFGITVGLFNEDNMFEWKCTILGPKDTFYKGGLFFLKIIFPDNYPNSKKKYYQNFSLYYIKITLEVLMMMLYIQKKMNLLIIQLYLKKRPNILQQNMHLLKLQINNIQMVGISLIIHKKYVNKGYIYLIVI